MTINERQQVRPWLRVVSGVIGLALTGAAGALFVAFLTTGELHADDLSGLALLVPFLGAGLLFLVVGLVGRSPSWLPAKAPGTWREFLYAMLWLIAVIALGEVARALDGWLRAHVGTSRGVSWFLSVLPSAIGFAVLLHYADRRKPRDAKSTRPVA